MYGRYLVYEGESNVVVVLLVVVILGLSIILISLLPSAGSRAN
jgi:hypothetical protein